MDIAQITLTRVEGRFPLPSPRVVTNLDAARVLLREWAASAPADGSYHKVDVHIRFADGSERSGTIGLRKPYARVNAIGELEDMVK